MPTGVIRAFRDDLYIRNRPKVSCWYHFAPQSHAPPAACDAHLRHLEQYRLDFLKVMFEFGYPRAGLGTAGVVQSVADLAKLRELPGDAPPFDRQLDLLRRLAQRIGGHVPMTTTIFHAWMELRNLTAAAPIAHRPPQIGPSHDPRDAALTALLRADRAAVAAALQALSRTLANFARECVKAGADGIYLATRDDWVDTPANAAALSLGPTASAYDALVAETDRTILAGAADGWFNVLHVCGQPLRLERHAGDPHVHVLHWADRVTGPSLADGRRLVEHKLGAAAARRLALAGGLDNLQTLPHGRPQDVAREVREALAAGRDRPLIIAPGCTYAPAEVPDANIRALVAAART
jgi:uroporphyrinogen decarboxylase